MTAWDSLDAERIIEAFDRFAAKERRIYHTAFDLREGARALGAFETWKKAGAIVRAATVRAKLEAGQ